MRILQIYNQYRSLFGGEEAVVRRTADLINRNGGETQLLMRTSRDLDRSLLGKAIAFLSGPYNPLAARQVRQVVKTYRPDIAHVHNLYPLFSPSALVELRRAGLPVVMTVHNHFLTCPRTDHLYRGTTCELCFGGSEFHCIRQNCRENLIESAGYALRSFTARKTRVFQDNVTIVIALSDFSAQRLVQIGFAPEQLVVLPNTTSSPVNPRDSIEGRYAMFAGRMSPEKGVPTLLAASRLLPDIPVLLAGDGPGFEDYRNSAPPNATFPGQLDGGGVSEAYRAARFLVVPSMCFEGCPLVVVEAMFNGLPVIASRIGGLPELVIDGVTGVFFEPGDHAGLADQMSLLWNDPHLCRRLGEAARERAIHEFAEPVYWKRLSSIYKTAIDKHRIAPS